MVLAGFYKHNLWAVPATALCWLASSDRRRAIRAAAVGTGAVALGLGLCGLIYGNAFFDQLLAPRHCSLWRALGSLGRLQAIAPALLVVVLWAGDKWRDEAARFTALFVGAAFVLHFLQRFGEGVADNAQFELAAAAAIGLGLALDRMATIRAFRGWRTNGARALIVSLLVARLLASGNTMPYRLIVSPELRASLRAQAIVVASEAARIAAIPGPVVCDVPTIARRAGKPFVYDAFAVSQRIKTGKLTQAEADRRIAAAGIRFEKVDPRTCAPWR
jgi:hypothetical protein